MILRGLHVENWCCIRSLTLADLPLGIVVLHGPNRTGKTSLVRALRCCLFDADHNSTREDIVASIPRSGGTPKVVVEFRAGQVDYRITKVFSTRKDGLALLEKKVGAGWQVEEDASKEASRKVRELLGCDKSTGGLNQLLWLTQGEVKLPNKIDVSLEKQLVGVFGVLITGPDLAFRQELERRYLEWYTEKTEGRLRKDSRVILWEQQRQDRLKVRDEERDKFRKWEHALKDLQTCQDSLPDCKKTVKHAEDECARLEKERDQGRERLRRYKEAEQALQGATRNVQQAEANLRKLEDARNRLQDREKDVAQALLKVQAAQAERDRLAHEHGERLQEVQAARQAEETHQRGREQIEDLRKLQSVAQKMARLEDVLSKVHKLAVENAELEEQVKNLSAPDDVTLKELRDNRRKAEGLRAQLQASALTLSIQLQRPMKIALSLDGQPVPAVELPAEEKKSWNLQQQVKLDIAGFGTIDLARSRADLDLERAARALAELDQVFRDTVLAFRENPEDEPCLDRLTERRIQRKTWEQQLHSKRQELRAQAPEGRAALEAERAQLTSQCRVIRERRPDLADWVPSPADVDDRAQAFETTTEKLRTARLQREAGETQARQAVQQAETRLQKLKEQSSAATAAAQASREEWQRLGDEALLCSAVEQARQAKSQAEENLTSSQLTEAEKTVDQRWEGAKNALRQRQQRLRELEDQLNQLRGFLQGNEGLHIRLSDAESHLQEAEQALARETLEASAHRRLRELFEECRENQVQGVLGPIAGRVLDWARRIGLDDYHEVRFGDKFLPEGLVLPNGTPNALVSLDEESYGTGEQLGLLVRLALGGVLAKDEPVAAILDDPLAHADEAKHRRILDVLQIAAEGQPSWNPPAGRLQIVILTCHPERFDYLPARHIDLAKAMGR